MAQLVQLVLRGLAWHTDRSPGHYLRVTSLAVLSCVPWLLAVVLAALLGRSSDRASSVGAWMAVVTFILLLLATVPATVLGVGEPRDRAASRRQERRSARG